MKTLSTFALIGAATAAVLGIGLAAGATADAGSDDSAPALCWLQLDQSSRSTALEAWASPAIAGFWSLRMTQTGSTRLESEQSGELSGHAVEPVSLARMVISGGPIPSLRNGLWPAAPAAGSGTTIISGSGVGPGEAGPFEAELVLFDIDGEVLCESRLEHPDARL